MIPFKKSFSLNNTFLSACKNYTVPARRDVFTIEISLLQMRIPVSPGRHFSSQLHYPGQTGQEGCLDARIKLKNNVFNKDIVQIDKVQIKLFLQLIELYLYEKTWLQPQKVIG